MNKRGQMKMSFGMIFSIILIIAFIGFAFFAISKFLALGKQAKYFQFEKDLKADIDELWKGSGKKQVEYILPSEVTRICFENDEFEDVSFTLKKGFGDGIKLKNVNFENKICIPSIDNKVTFILNKPYGQSFVTVENE